ncbi:ABC transporter permease [Chitinophaga sancti]|uniref:FtsX-like permease family protein n=1 Tax=Chitinophaga sancti TaxID=1004 RepID=A0A1K1SJL3_9BACT|nr:ABC transporter permease [Chitinophaga sancti]WQD64494.1 FtsX-like permease family protein [Chitinophaga sancti]WQG89882.1 FtsX-like permease family protein [Chitinophaga sancti]SFW84502.1 FtsX-like permease family protein [Chitinophaga sancti]
MFKNYFKIAFRNLLRTKTFSFINITGLVMGMSCCMLICLWIYNEVTFDKFHQHRETLYQIYNRATVDGKLFCWNYTPKPLAAALRKDYPGIANTCRTSTRTCVTVAGDKKISSKAMTVDTSFLNMFTFPLLKGNKATALNDPNAMIVTEKMAMKMFGTTDVIDKVISIDGENFKITGLLKNLPVNSTFDFECLFSWLNWQAKGQDDHNWGNNSISTYVQLTPNVTESAMDNRIKEVTIKNSNGELPIEVFLHPMSKWHLYSKFEDGKITGGRIEIVRFFGFIAIFILLIACINFMNLSTARSEKRAKEVGIRKVAGAMKKSLISQFLIESILLTAIAGILAIILVFLTLPAFNRMLDQELVLPYGTLAFWTILPGFILFTGLLAGSYPAFFLSSQQPAGIFRGSFKRINGTISPRKILVVIQFCISTILIISTVIIVRQLDYARNRNSGFTGDLLIYHELNAELSKNRHLVKEELLSAGLASSVTATAGKLTETYSSTWGIFWRGKPEKDNTIFERKSEEGGLVGTAGLKLIMGRDIDLVKFPSDSSAVLLNETAAKIMGFSNPIGETIKDENRVYHVIGVFGDIVFDSPFENNKPVLLLGPKYDYMTTLHIRLSPATDAVKQMAEVEKIFTKYCPSYPFEYHFVNEDYAKKFEDMQRVARLTTLFAILTIFISCLGLFGLASYIAEGRVKEIGIRKVLGASAMKIITLLTKDFIVLVAISLVISAPIAWYAMHKWLQGYAYRISIDWWIFVGAAILVMLISLFTTGYHAYKATLANPVKSLKAE